MSDIVEKSIDTVENPAEDSPATATETALPAKTEKKPKKKIFRKILCSAGVLLLALAIFLAVYTYDSIKTIHTVEQIDDGIYKITYEKDYKLDDALALKQAEG